MVSLNEILIDNWNNIPRQKICPYVTRVQLQNDTLIDIATFLVRRWSGKENVTIEFSKIKQNEIYVLTLTDNIKEWVKYTREEINQIEYELTKKLMGKFREWEAKNRERLFSDTYSINYQNNLNKIMGGKLSRDTIKKTFYDILFNINKVNFN